MDKSETVRPNGSVWCSFTATHMCVTGPCLRGKLKTLKLDKSWQCWPFFLNLWTNSTCKSHVIIYLAIVDEKNYTTDPFFFLEILMKQLEQCEPTCLIHTASLRRCFNFATSMLLRVYLLLCDLWISKRLHLIPNLNHLSQTVQEILIFI